MCWRPKATARSSAAASAWRTTIYCCSASRTTTFRRRPSSGISICGATAACRTAASAWASSAWCRGFASSITCAKRFPIRGCSTGCTPESLMKIGLISLGCPKNLVDSEVMLGLAQLAGHVLTNDAADADVLVVNTCAFIDSAKQESIDTILEMAQHKQNGACQRLVVTGCLGERYRDELKKQIPEIDAVLGTGEVPDIVRALGGAAAPLPFFRSADSLIPSPKSLPTYIYDADTPRHLATPKHYAYVKIAEGCDYKCAFCIIPTLRGHYRSRPADSIVREARALAARGVKELLLISQDTTFYGIDRQERGALARLLRELNSIDNLEWIRLLYLYPTTIDDDTLAAMAECDKVCKYIDLPLQHASNAVLKRMKRPGTHQSYDTLLGRIRTRVPGVALRTTNIAGFT